jgi:hypothetical protein
METAVNMMVSQKFWPVEMLTPKSGKTTTEVAQLTPIPDMLLSVHSARLAVFDCDMLTLLMVIIYDYTGGVTFSDKHRESFLSGQQIDLYICF